METSQISDQESSTNDSDFEEIEVPIETEISADSSMGDSMDSIDEEISEDDGVKLETPMSMQLIACLLAMLKRRHRLSIQCMSDLLRLFTIMGVDNVPRSWYQLKRLIVPVDRKPSCFYPCSRCSKASVDQRTCSNCGQSLGPDIYKDSFLTLSIKDQIENVLNNNGGTDLFSSSSNSIMSDITDGPVYQQIKATCLDLFITLTMNIDGIEVKKGSKKSIWPILMVINELPLKRRYALENTLVAGI
ncbi:unnamed protein product [Rotaria magnacalcarata]